MKPLIGILLLIGLIGLVVLVGCKEDPPASVFDPNVVAAPTPQLTSISPAGFGWAGVSVITLTGTNFSAVMEKNLVFFDATPGTVIQASATQLQVKVPLYVKDSITVRVAVNQANEYSPPLKYTLKAAVTEFSKFQTFEEPWATTVDSGGNVYVSLISAGAGAGIKKIAPDGTRSDFAVSGGVTKFSALKIGPGGDIYAARLARAIYRIPAAGGTPALWMQITGTILSDLDFDPDGNIWTGGPGQTSVYRVKVSDKSFKAFPFLGDVRSIRYFDGYLYVGGRPFTDSLERVTRFRVYSTDSLGAAEEYFNLKTAGYTGRFIYAINFSADGDLFIGTEGTNPIIVVHPSKSSEIFFPGLLSPTTHILPWGQGPYLLAVTGTASGGAVSSSSKIWQINSLKANGAPYYGRP